MPALRQVLWLITDIQLTHSNREVKSAMAISISAGAQTESHQITKGIKLQLAIPL